MQKIQVYLYPNRITVLTNLDENLTNTEWRIVYQRQVKIYKGIDNIIEIEIKNNDQKPVSIGTNQIKLVLMDQTRHNINTYIGTSLEDSTHVGIARITIPSIDLNNLDPQFLKFVVYQDQPSGPDILTYTDSQFGAVGSIQLLDGINTISNTITKYDRWTTETNYQGSRWESRKIYTISESINLMDYRSNPAQEVILKIKLKDFYGTLYIEGTNVEVIGNEAFRNAAKLLEFTWEGYNGIWTTSPISIQDLAYLRVKYTKTAGSVDYVELVM
ncbi:hypothetical protein EBU71_07895 [bacterium]|nr:hypothetical protein [Candidatus Elulimicrobium humile]